MMQTLVGVTVGSLGFAIVGLGISICMFGFKALEDKLTYGAMLLFFITAFAATLTGKSLLMIGGSIVQYFLKK